MSFATGLGQVQDHHSRLHKDAFDLRPQAEEVQEIQEHVHGEVIRLDPLHLRLRERKGYSEREREREREREKKERG